jgi:hypothetical protein
VLNVAPVLVQVEGSGVDWPAVVASIATGVAAVAGIAGTLWQASRNWSHEDKKAKIAEKRRVYANCLAAFNAGLDSEMVVKMNKQSNSVTVDEINKSTAAIGAYRRAFFELQLIAPQNVGDLSSKVMDEIYAYPSKSNSNDVSRTLADLTKAMRVDLGEPPLAALTTPGALTQNVDPSHPET